MSNADKFSKKLSDGTTIYGPKSTEGRPGHKHGHKGSNFDRTPHSTLGSAATGNAHTNAGHPTKRDSQISGNTSRLTNPTVSKKQPAKTDTKKVSVPRPIPVAQTGKAVKSVSVPNPKATPATKSSSKTGASGQSRSNELSSSRTPKGQGRKR